MTPRRLALTTAALLIVVALGFMRPSATPGPVMRDFEAYYAAGATWHAGANPYGREIWRVERHVPGVVATRDELLPFVGPPFTLPFWALLAGLGFARAAIVWGGLLVAAVAAFVFAILRIAGARDAASVCAAIALAVAFGPLTSAFALGQVALVACAGVTLATLALNASAVRPAIAAAILAAAQPNLGVALIARLSDRRAWFALGVAAALVGAGSVAALGGFAAFAQYIAVLAAHAAAERTIAIQMTATGVAFGLGAPARSAPVIGVALALAVLVVMALLLRGRTYAPADRVAIACAALPLLLPFAHEHDLAITLFPAIVCLRRARRALWPLAAVATMAIAVDWLGLAQRPSGLAQSVALAAAAALAAMALSRGRLGAVALAPLGVVLLVALAGRVAARHPVPVWPDALGATFRAAARAEAPDVWSAEQSAAGLAKPDAPSALLRLGSLTGCGVLWIVALAALRRPGDVGAPAH